MSRLTTLISLALSLASADARLRQENANRHHNLAARAAPTNIPSGWSYIGCTSDPSSARVLPTKPYDSTTANSQTKCLSVCSQGSYLFAGMEWGEECW